MLRVKALERWTQIKLNTGGEGERLLAMHCDLKADRQDGKIHEM